jgi:hypothetical protein
MKDLCIKKGAPFYLPMPPVLGGLFYGLRRVQYTFTAAIFISCMKTSFTVFKKPVAMNTAVL